MTTLPGIEKYIDGVRMYVNGSRQFIADKWDSIYKPQVADRKIRRDSKGDNPDRRRAFINGKKSY